MLRALAALLLVVFIARPGYGKDDKPNGKKATKAPSAPSASSAPSPASDEYRRFVSLFIHYYLNPTAPVGDQALNNMKKTTFMLVAGLGNEFGPQYFLSTRLHLHEHGVHEATAAPPSSFADLDSSADRLVDKLSHIEGPITLVCHSMGINVILVALIKKPSLIKRVKIISLNGAPMGSEHARDFEETGTLPADNMFEKLMGTLLSPFVNKDTLKAVPDLVPETIRERWQKAFQENPDLVEKIGKRLYWVSSFVPPKTRRGKRLQSTHGANDTAVPLEQQHLEVTTDDGKVVTVGTELIRLMAHHLDLVGGPSMWPSTFSMQNALHKALFAHLFTPDAAVDLGCPLDMLVDRVPPINHEFHPGGW